jgi:phosphoglycolate phosphatase
MASAVRFERRTDQRTDAAPTVLFDFDGTLADSFSAMFAAYNQSAVHRGLPLIDAERFELLRELAPREVLAQLRVPLWKVPALMVDVRLALRDRMSEIAPFAGVPALLEQLRAAGCVLGIVSSNSRENIDAFCERHGLPPFSFYRCGVSLLGKASQLRKLMDAERLLPARTFYLGDEVRDVQAAAAVGARSVAVSWGYGGRSGLAASAPDFLVSSPAQILECVLGAEAAGRDRHAASGSDAVDTKAEGSQ